MFTDAILGYVASGCNLPFSDPPPIGEGRAGRRQSCSTVNLDGDVLILPQCMAGFQNWYMEGVYCGVHSLPAVLHLFEHSWKDPLRL